MIEYTSESPPIQADAQFKGMLQSFGANILPIKGDTKRPIGKWDHWQTTAQSPEYLNDDRWLYASKTGIVNGWGQWRSIDFDDCPLAVVYDFLEAIGLDRDYPWLEASQSGKGYHIWVLCPDDALFGLSESDKGVYTGKSRDGAFKQIEIRWRDSQTVIAGKWENGTPDTLPAIVESAKIVRAFQRLTRPESAEAKGGDEWSTIPNGQRDVTLTAIAGGLRAKGMARETMRPVLYDLNERLCQPPLPDSQVDKIVDSIGSKAAGSLNQRDAGPIPFLSFDELMERPDPVFLVDGILVEQSLAVLSAPQSHYKSFIALDMAASIATGIEWAGHTVKPGPVLFVVAEGAAGMRKRLAAWSIAHGGEKPDVTTIPMAVQMMVPADVDRLLSGIRELGKDYRLIVIDTLSRTMAGYDENQQKDMSGYVGALERLQRETGATVLVIHHHNREGKIRGSSVLSGAIDTEMSLKPFSDDVTELFCLKQKDFEYFPSHYFQKVVIDLPNGQTSLTFEPTEPNVSIKMDKVMTNKGETTALAELGRFPGGRAAKVDWFAASSLKKPTFYRATGSLEAKGLVRDVGEGVYVLAESQSQSQSHSVSFSPVSQSHSVSPP